MRYVIFIIGKLSLLQKATVISTTNGSLVSQMQYLFPLIEYKDDPFVKY